MTEYKSGGAHYNDDTPGYIKFSASSPHFVAEVGVIAPTGDHQSGPGEPGPGLVLILYSTIVNTIRLITRSLPIKFPPKICSFIADNVL